MGFGDVGKAKSAVQNIFPIVDRKPLIGGDEDESLIGAGAEEEAAADKVATGEIEFVNVDFCYPSRLDVTVFKGFSLMVPSGKVGRVASRTAAYHLS